MKRFFQGVVTLGLLFGAAGQIKAQYLFTRLVVPGAQPASENTALGINNAGQIVGNCTLGPFLLSRGSVTIFRVPGPYVTIPQGINDAGQIVGSYGTVGLHSFLYSGGSYATFDPPGSAFSNAFGINASGQIVGSYNDAAGRTHGFVLTSGNYSTLDVPGAAATAALGINASGQIVGSYMDARGTHHGFLRSGDSYTTFDVPGANQFGTEAYGINDSGKIVGTYSAAHGFLLSGDSYTTLDFVNRTTLRGINDLGEIVGYYSQFVEGDTHNFGFLATPTPEPASWVLIALGTMSIIGWAWWKKPALTRTAHSLTIENPKVVL